MRDQFFEDGTQNLKPEKTVDLRGDYSENGLQVTVKLANIHLTPKKPKCKGGSWHVNEYICAPAIYYSSNIPTSRLASLNNPVQRLSQRFTNRTNTTGYQLCLAVSKIAQAFRKPVL